MTVCLVVSVACCSQAVIDYRSDNVRPRHCRKSLHTDDNSHVPSIESINTLKLERPHQYYCKPQLGVEDQHITNDHTSL